LVGGGGFAVHCICCMHAAGCMYGRSHASVVCTISSSQRRGHGQDTAVPANPILEGAYSVCICRTFSSPTFASRHVLCRCEALPGRGARGTGVVLLLAIRISRLIRFATLHMGCSAVAWRDTRGGLLAGSRMFPLPRCVRPLWDRGSLRCRARARGSWRGDKPRMQGRLEFLLCG
jgi:hypothetical protein